MSNSKAIRTQISSIKSTQKITRAMQLVSASKIHKAQKNMLESSHYAQKIREVIGHFAHSHTEVKHPFIQGRNYVQAIGFIVVSSDRGLCGGLNLNLVRKLETDFFREAQNNHQEIRAYLVGKKSFYYLKKFGIKIIASCNSTTGAVSEIVGTVKVAIDDFEKGKIDKLYIATNEFINTIIQRPAIYQLLPFQKSEKNVPKAYYWDYIYETDPNFLLKKLFIRYLETQVRQAILSNIACEQGARMLSMKNATDNAEILVKNLELIYNKTRQAAITTEISEIIGGANSV